MAWSLFYFTEIKGDENIVTVTKLFFQYGDVQ